jgi:hypothetical protein
MFGCVSAIPESAEDPLKKYNAISRSDPTKYNSF